MKRKVILLLLPLAWTASCSHSPETPIYKIYELCGKEKTDPVVVAKIKELDLEDVARGGGHYDRYYEPQSRTDYKYVSVTINPQPTLSNIQGIFITWKKDLGGLSYEEIQRTVGIALPKRGAKEIQTDQAMDYSTKFYVQDHKSLHHIDSQVTVTCAKNDYNRCCEIDIACFGFVHPD